MNIKAITNNKYNRLVPKKGKKIILISLVILKISCFVSISKDVL